MIRSLLYVFVVVVILCFRIIYLPYLFGIFFVCEKLRSTYSCSDVLRVDLRVLVCLSVYKTFELLNRFPPSSRYVLCFYCRSV